MKFEKEKIFNLIGAAISEKGIISKTTTTLFNSEVAKKSERGGFYFKQSTDEGALLIMHTSRFPKEDAIKYEVKLFDDKLATLFSSEEKVNFDDSKKDYEFTISDFELNFQDDVFLVINESYRDSKKKEQIEKFQIHAFKRANKYTKEVIDINIKGNPGIILMSGLQGSGKTTFTGKLGNYLKTKKKYSLIWTR